MKFYRYKDVLVANIGVQIQLLEFHLVKETPKGYWIKPRWDITRNNQFQKWISNNGKNRYAYPTKEEALFNFKKRKERQVLILEVKLSDAKVALMKAETMERKNET